MPNYMTLSPDMLPQGSSSVTFDSSSFFTRNSPNATLPSPSQVTALRDTQHPRYRGTAVHPPIIFEDLGLLVKYGEEPRVTVSEAQCLWALRKFLPQVPVPEIYGWVKEGPYTFLYMEYIKGATLKERWISLTDSEKTDVCRQLREMFLSLRELVQDPSQQFIGDVQHGPLGDIVFTNGVLPRAGPFASVADFHDWLSMMVKRPAMVHRPGIPLSDIPDPYRQMIPDDVPIVFTHADLNPVNIMVSWDSPCRVQAIIDWQQSGWYPAYWEYCKAEYTVVYGEEWQAQYLPLILEEPSCVEGFDNYARAFGH